MIRVLVAALFIQASALSLPVQADAFEPKGEASVVVPGFLSEKAFEQLRREALAGNSESSFILFEVIQGHYREVDGMFWLVLSAEQGNCEAIELLSKLINERPEPEFATDWMKRWKARSARCDRGSAPSKRE